MRRLQLLGLCLAVVAFGVRAEEAAENVEFDLKDDLEDVSDDVVIDLNHMLGELFESELVLLCAALGMLVDRLQGRF